MSFCRPCHAPVAPLVAIAFFTIASIVSAADMLKNPGLESLGAGWGKWGSADFHDWAKESGNSGAALWGWTKDGAGGIFQSVPCEAGRQYTFSIRMRKEPLFQASIVFLKFEFYTDDDTTKAGRDQGFINVAETLTGDWQTFTITGMAPVGTRFIRPVVGFEGATSGDLGKGQQACVMDNASLTLSPP